MTTDPTPSPDVRELAIRTIVAIIDEKAKQRRAGWTTSARRAATEYAAAVLAAVSPVIRRQERMAVAAQLRDEIRLQSSWIWHQLGESNLEMLAQYVEWSAAAIARTHAHPEEGK